MPKHSSATFLSADEALDDIVRGILALGIGLSLTATSPISSQFLWACGIAALLVAAVLWGFPRLTREDSPPSF